MAKPTIKRTVVHDNPFTIDYHRTGAAKLPTKGRRTSKRSVDDYSGEDGYKEDVTDSVHPISSKNNILLGEAASGCDWNDHVVLPDAKGVHITAKEIVFAFKANDTDKEVYIKSMVAMVRNIIFNVDISYTLIYKRAGGFEAVVDTFTTTNAVNSQGKFVGLTLSGIAKKDIVMAVLELSPDQIKSIAYASSNIKTANPDDRAATLSNENELMAG